LRWKIRPDELGAPASLQHFIADTHLHDLRLCFDTGHAHIEEGVEVGFDAMRERVVTAHIHDNHGEKDEHLLPYEGNIDWEAGLAALANAPQSVALVLELKEQPAEVPRSIKFARRLISWKRISRKSGHALRSWPLKIIHREVNDSG